MLFQINKSLNHFLTPTLLPLLWHVKQHYPNPDSWKSERKKFQNYILGIFGVKIPLNVSTVSLPSPSHTFHGAASELDFTLHSRSSKNEIFHIVLWDFFTQTANDSWIFKSIGGYLLCKSLSSPQILMHNLCHKCNCKQ